MTIFSLICFSCAQNEAPKQTKINPVFETLISDSSLIASSFLDVNVISNEEVLNKSVKNANWQTVLSPFLTLKIPNLNSAEKVIDSFKNLKIETYYFSKVKGKNQIETLVLNTLNQKIQLIEVVQKTKSAWVNKQITYSYQPTKGYSITTIQKFAWSKPNKTILHTLYSSL